MENLHCRFQVKWLIILADAFCCSHCHPGAIALEAQSFVTEFRCIFTVCFYSVGFVEMSLLNV